MECTTSTTSKGRIGSFALAVTITICLVSATTGRAQEALQNGSVAPMGQWLEYREASFVGKPILIHLRTGYERAIVMPEPVELRDADQTLPDSEIVVTDNIIAFYPTSTFARVPLLFTGLETGTQYDLRVRASTEGMRQPLRINRQ